MKKKITYSKKPSKKIKQAKSSETRFGFTPSQTALVMGIVFLVIFAFIAAPLYNSCKKKQIIAKLRTVHAALLQAGKMSSITQGVDEGEFDTTISAKDFAKKYIMPYLNIESVCETSQDNCWDNPNYKDLHKKGHYNDIEYSLILPDRTIIGFRKDKNGLITALADINGKTGENTLGYDVFVFYFYNSKNLPKLCDNTEFSRSVKNGIHVGGYDECGIPHDEHEYMELFDKKLADGCNKKAVSTQYGAGAGAACAALVYKSSWNMDKVYPW